MNEFPSSIRKVSDIKPQSEVVETAHHVFFKGLDQLKFNLKYFSGI